MSDTAIYPEEFVHKEEIKLRLGVKSSLKNVRQFFALVYSLYLSNNNKSFINYSKEYYEGSLTSISINDDALNDLMTFFGHLVSSEDDFKVSVNNNRLFTLQIEPLQVALELVWRLAKIDIIDKPNQIERKGGNRFNKVLRFSTNMILLNTALLNESNLLELKELLFSWIMLEDNSQPPTDSELSKKLQLMLTIFTEEAKFKVRENVDGTKKNEIEFQQHGIYQPLINNIPVISKDSFEIVGPFRILKSVTIEGFHSFIKDDENRFEIVDGESIDSLKNYYEMVNTYLDLIPKRTILYVDQDQDQESESFKKLVSNTIYYGAPGTGKSHAVTDLLVNVDKKYKETVTFHPDYDYVSFVGGYRPISEEDNNGVESIKYKFVPQVFTNIYVNAWKNPQEQFYLVIEEINRGNCAEIFGDIFQLLDQNQDYTVTPSSELNTYLVNELSEKHEGIVDGLKMPPNLSILATMNTSDQSLFPMDSAFKRRWEWEYIPINYDESNNPSSKFIVEFDDKTYFSWLDFIEKVNDKIKNNHNLGMDKCIGNYFINPTDNIISLKTFINKAIFYLWNDVFKDEFGDESIFGEGVSYEDFFPIEKNGAKMVIALLETLDFKLSDGKYTVLNEDTN